MNMNTNNQEPTYLVFKHQFETQNPFNGQIMTLPSGYYIVPYPIRGDKIVLAGSLQDISKAFIGLLHFSIN